MAISFKCAGCGKQYSVDNALAGKKAQCKACGGLMKIPRLAPSHEPDLGLEGAEARSNEETVAGSLVQGSIETVAGQSVSGQSASGKSLSGRSAAGRSAAGQPAERSATGRRVSAPPPEYAPPPMDDAPSELEALKHVPRSEEDAFDVRGGVDPSLHGAMPLQPNRSPPEVVSMLLTAGLLGALGYAAYAKTQLATAALPPAVATEAGKPLAAVGVQAAIIFALTLAVAAPLVMAGWVGACKLLNFRTPRGVYLRSLGLAALPTIAFVLAYVTGLGASAAALALATAALGYLVLHFVHQQKPLLAGAATGLGTIGGAVGVAAAVMVADNVSQGMTQEYSKVVAAAYTKVAQRDALARANKPTNTGPAKPAANAAEAEAMVKALRGRVDALKTRMASPQQTREAVDAEATSVADAIDEAKKTYTDHAADWDTMAGELQSAQAGIAQLPTSRPPAELNQQPPAGTEWGVRAGQREASAFAFNFTPPPNALLDLDSAIASEGAPLTWSASGSQAKIRLELVRGASGQQQRPWVAPAYVIAAAKDAPVSVAVDGKSTTEYGTINGLPAAKIVAGEGDTGRILTVYTLHNGDTWLKATIGPAAPNDNGFEAAELAVRSLRVRAPGEPALDPLPAGDLVARFNDDPTSAEKVATLLRGKPGAEDAVLKGIGFAPDDATLKKFGPLLAASATGDKGARFLWKLADDNDATATASRETLRRIQPKAADDVAFALLDVKSTNRDRVRTGLEALEAAEVDKARQQTVTRTLVGAFEQLTTGSHGKLLESVLGKWLDDDLGRRVQAVLENPSSGETERRMAMRVLATTGKPKYVAAICKWLVVDPASVDTLVQMGPMVEGDVIRALTDKDNFVPKFRLAAINVLSEVGTPRSVTTLQKMSGAGDIEVRDAAKAAIARIRERDAASRTAQPK